jgi:hypothetical protein
VKKTALNCGSVRGIRLWQQHSTAFDGNGDGLQGCNGKTKMAFNTSSGGWQWALAFDNGNGQRQALGFDSGIGQQQQQWQRRMTMVFNAISYGRRLDGGEAVLAKMAFNSGWGGGGDSGNRRLTAGVENNNGDRDGQWQWQWQRTMKMVLDNGDGDVRGGGGKATMLNGCGGCGSDKQQ